MADLVAEPKVVMRGAHTTTLSRYKNIVARGFQLGHGRGGSGVYFWAEAKRYLDLSKAWYDWSLANRRYATDAEKGCIIIIALLTAPSKQVLDLEEQKLKDAIDTLAERRRLESSSVGDLAKLYDLFISSLEQKRGFGYLIVRLRVAKPPEPYLRGYSVERLGSPESYIARDPSIITREKVLGHEYEELDL